MICPTCKKEVSIRRKEIDEFGKIIIYFSCGHKLFQVTIKESIKVHEMLSIRKKSQEKFSKKHKWEYEALSRERVGRHGKPVFINQIIDRIQNYYKKFVKHGNKIIKDIEQKLTEHKG